MIADVLTFAISGIGFCHAAGSMILHKGFVAGKNTIMTQNWTRWLA
jgi:hypothetical protein